MINNIPLSGLGPREVEFLVTMASRCTGIFDIDKAHDYWGDPDRTRKAIANLERKGWLKRIERGKYLLIPLEAGPERLWAEDAMVVASSLFKDSAIAYWTALNYWGMTTQVPQTVFIQSTSQKRKPAKPPLGIRLKLVTVSPKKFFGFSTQHINGFAITMTDREKTLIDCLDRPDLCGGIKELAKALQDEKGGIDWDRFDGYLMRFPSGAVAKRAGFIIEVMDIAIPDQSARIPIWRGKVTSGYTMLEPGIDGEGRLNRRWGIRNNIGLSR